MLVLRERKNVINLNSCLAQSSYEKLTSQLHNSSVRSLFLSFSNIDIIQILFDINSSNAIIFVSFISFNKDSSSSSFVCFRFLARVMLRNMRLSNSWGNWWEKMLIIFSYRVFCSTINSRKMKSLTRREIRWWEELWFEWLTSKSKVRDTLVLTNQENWFVDINEVASSSKIM